MLKFLWLWALIGLPLPVIVYRYLPKSRQVAASLRIPFFRDVAEQGLTAETPPVSSLILAAAFWLALVVAATRPVWIHESVEVPISGRDILLALDTSGSMEQQDFSATNHSRFEVVRSIAGEFVERRKGDRVGLILFGSLPYLYAPLTFDVDTVVEFLKSSQTKFAGSRTAIGDSIGLAVKVLRERPAQNRILILLTDGENSAGAIDPLQAMQLAVEHGIRIYAIGIGSAPQSSTGLNQSDANVLARIAQATGGTYFHASNPRQLEQIYATIDSFEPIEAEVKSRVIANELYPWLLALSMLMLLALILRFAVSNLVPGAVRRIRGHVVPS